MAGDWVKVHRSLMDSAVWADDWLVRLWIWCLLRANHKPGNWRGEVVNRGEFITGRSVASDELGVSPSKWYRGIMRLAELGNITVSANSVWTRITVCNYSTYQDRSDDDRTANEQRMNSERTANEQRADTSKKGRREEGKNEKKINRSSVDEQDLKAAEWFAAYLDRVFPGRIELSSERRAATISRWAKTFHLMIKRDKRHPIVIANLMKKVEDSSFWVSQILSPKTLRDKFDDLSARLGTVQAHTSSYGTLTPPTNPEPLPSTT